MTRQWTERKKSFTGRLTTTTNAVKNLHMQFSKKEITDDQQICPQMLRIETNMKYDPAPVRTAIVSTHSPQSIQTSISSAFWYSVYAKVILFLSVPKLRHLGFPSENQMGRYPVATSSTFYIKALGFEFCSGFRLQGPCLYSPCEAAVVT